MECECGNGEQLNEQAARLREMLGANVEDDPQTTFFTRRHRHRGGRHHKDSWNRDKGTSRRRAKCLSESAAHVPVMSEENQQHSPAGRSVEDGWEVVG